MKSSKRFCLVEIIENKKAQGVRRTMVLWTFQGEGGKLEIRGSIAPPRPALQRTVAQVVDWAISRHERLQRRSEGARVAREVAGPRRGIQDAMTLATAHRLQKRLSREED